MANFPTIATGVPFFRSFGGLAPILDLYPNAAAAYSLRLLRTAYSGNCIRVRRSSDNTEQDIGFANNTLNTANLLSFVGANDGFITKWYDQSGNGIDIIQVVAGFQPQIVSSGSLITLNSKAAINSTTTYLTYATAGITNSYAFSVGQITAVNSLNTLFNTTATSGDSGNVRINSPSLYYRSPSTSTSDANDYTGASAGAMYFNGSLISASSDATKYHILSILRGAVITNTGLTIGNSLGIARGFNGKLQELILYPTTQASNRVNIESNLNTYYGVY
jgi:hypothetical protein